MRYDAFISYRRDNGFHLARIIRDYLESKGLVPFMDLHDIHEGQFDRRITDAIANTDNFILVLSPSALNRCADANKEDWMRTEILQAVQGQKNIIPVHAHGFKWPDHLQEKLPEEISRLKTAQAIDEKPSYFDEMLSRIHQRLKNITPHTIDTYAVQSISATATTSRYFDEQLLITSGTCSIDMAFHAGVRWFMDSEKIQRLIDLLQKGHSIRVLINTPESAESIARHMRMRYMRYTPFTVSLAYWTDLAQEFGNLSVRVTETPIMRRYYSFHMADSSLDTVNVKHYTYGNGQDARNYQSIFTPQSSHFQLYREEFAFLWESATPLGTYAQTR